MLAVAIFLRSYITVSEHCLRLFVGYSSVTQCNVGVRIGVIMVHGTTLIALSGCRDIKFPKNFMYT